MNRLAPLVAVLSLIVGGCALHSAHPPANREAFVGNAAEFDAYASRRAEDLLRMGATKDPSEAASQAQVDAERRYGPRTPTDSASWRWTTEQKTPSPTRSELDQALAKSATAGTGR